jgi:crotonobetainyl-CoA:carnitine CoA-transferase CaiB-like acyl-CoA transferase
MSDGGSSLSVRPLRGRRVVSVAVNLPGPIAARRLADLGAHVIKVEPPAGDPLATYAPELYAELSDGMEIVVRDLKEAPAGSLLVEADVLLSSSRPSSLERLGLDPAAVAAHTRLCHVAIVGYAGDAEAAGHDLNYQAAAGLVRASQLPASLLADVAGGERAAFAALALLAERERTGRGGAAEVALADAASALAAPLRAGLTAAGAVLGGGNPFYAVYKALSGFVAVGCVERQFADRLAEALNARTADELTAAFAQRPADYWEQWARARDLPINAVRKLA